MKTKTKEKQVTQTLRGAGWTFSVTGSKAFVRRMVKKYVPEIQSIAKGNRRGQRKLYQPAPLKHL